MKWLPEFSNEGLLSPSDISDKSTLKDAIGQKTKVLQAKTLVPPSDKSDESLEASKQRLESADIRLAVFLTETDAGLIISGERLVQGESAAREAWRQGGIVFDAGEMFVYVHVTPEERQLFLRLKRMAGAR